MHFDHNPFFIITAGSAFIFSLAAVIQLLFATKRPNPFFGYRMASSMKSEERWRFAQRFSAIVLLQSCAGMLLLAFLGSLFIFPATFSIVSGLSIVGIGLLAMVTRTEKALKRFP